jgi:5-methylthioadenosine/S-adenosylhomocysteine deaminase
MIDVDLIVEAGQLITINENNEILENYALIIKQNKIIDILPYENYQSKYHSENIIDASNQIVMPGFINTHSHIAMAYFKGLADDLALDIWLNQYIWPAEAKCLNPEFVFEASLNGIAELIRSGVTCFNDMYFYPDETIKACNQANMRALIGDITLDFPMGDFHHPQNNLKNFHKYKNLIKNNDLIDISIAPHSIYVCSKQTWLNCIAVAKQENCIIHTHLSETEQENIDCKKQNDGLSPIQYLESLGALDTKTILAHGVHLDSEDISIIKNKDCSIALNIHSNLKLASGFPPIPEYLQNNINLSIGTDSVASNNKLSCVDEISTIAKLYKALYKNPTAISAKSLVRMATIDSAKALGKQDVLGSLEIGKLADLITIDCDNFLSNPIYDPYSYIVYSMDRLNINDTIINGKVVLRNKKLQTIDEMLLLKNSLKNKNNIISRIKK